jgi:hypothetical protein
MKLTEEEWSALNNNTPDDRYYSSIKVTYVAMEADGHKPIVTAETFDDLKKGLDEYYAVDRTDAICLGFTPYVTKYPDDYQGHYGYKWTMIIRDEKIIQIDTIRVYCVEFFPTTRKIGAKKEK